MSGSSSWSDRRIGGWAGIAAAITYAVSTVLPGSPPEEIDAPAEEIAAFMVDSRSSGLFALLLLSLSVPLFIVFAGSVRDRIAERVERGLADAGALSGVLFMVLSLVAAVTFFAVAWIDGRMEVMSPEVAQVSWNLANVLYAMANPLAALFVAVVGVAGLRGALRPWHAWSSLVVAVVLVVGVIGIVQPDLAMVAFLGLILFTLWVLVTSIVMVREA